jgi:hypothetical protein
LGRHAKNNATFKKNSLNYPELWLNDGGRGGGGMSKICSMFQDVYGSTQNLECKQARMKRKKMKTWSSFIRCQSSNKQELLTPISRTAQRTRILLTIKNSFFAKIKEGKVNKYTN